MEISPYVKFPAPALRRQALDGDLLVVMDRREITGYLYILVGTTLWGGSIVVAKSLFNIGLPVNEQILAGEDVI